MCLQWSPLARAGEKARPSLQSYTGLLNMPNARVLPDWNMRLHYGKSDPYSYYGGALGLFDRLEVHGQFTKVDTITAFPEHDYGAYKDRSAGARLVLLPEKEYFPQLAGGFFDATGTGLFGQRYLVASKEIGDFDLTFGLGQGTLAGEYVPDKHPASGQGNDRAFSYLLSSPKQKTKPFGGLEYSITPRLIGCIEYSPIERKNMFGYRDKGGKKLKEANQHIPFNLGLKYRLTKNLTATAAYMRGDNLALSAGVDFPLDPHGMLGWKKEDPPSIQERTRWRAYSANNKELARIVGGHISDDGFSNTAVACSNNTVWIEAENTRYLSDERALSRMAAIADSILPSRIQKIICNIIQNGQVITSLKTNRQVLRDFLASRLDHQGFLEFSDIDLYGSSHWEDFKSSPGSTGKESHFGGILDFSLQPRVRTFLNNRSGFFKHKAVIQAEAKLHPWEKGTLHGTYEWTVFNQYDDVIYKRLEDREAVRTDMLSYQERSAPRLTELALEQYWQWPLDIQTRWAAGAFESAYAGLGAECFRYLYDGYFGVGLEGEIVRKRSVEDNFSLREDMDHLYHTEFVNLYAQLWPEEGLEGGLKIGRFLAGDPGVRLDLRRSFKYFTLGGWLTWTDTSMFESPKNKEAMQKGVYIRAPFSIFFDQERTGHFTYGITSFTRDQGTTVNQPTHLYPMNPWSTPAHVRDNISKMRHPGALK